MNAIILPGQTCAMSERSAWTTMAHTIAIAMMDSPVSGKWDCLLTICSECTKELPLGVRCRCCCGYCWVLPFHLHVGLSSYIWPPYKGVIDFSILRFRKARKLLKLRNLLRILLCASCKLQGITKYHQQRVCRLTWRFLWLSPFLHANYGRLGYFSLRGRFETKHEWRTQKIILGPLSPMQGAL